MMEEDEDEESQRHSRRKSILQTEDCKQHFKQNGMLFYYESILIMCPMVEIYLVLNSSQTGLQFPLRNLASTVVARGASHTDLPLLLSLLRQYHESFLQIRRSSSSQCKLQRNYISIQANDSTRLNLFSFWAEW